MNGRSWILLALPLAGCAPPEDALVASCTTGVTSLSTECQLRAAKLPGPRSSYIDAGSRWAPDRKSAKNESRCAAVYVHTGRAGPNGASLGSR